MTNHYLNGSFQTNCETGSEDICLQFHYGFELYYFKFFFIEKYFSSDLIIFNTQIKPNDE